MDLSMNNINNITLSYFTNKSQYEHILKNNLNTKSNHDDLEYTKDKRFYKKRILDLNKKLFRNEIEDKELVKHFDIYVKKCIQHLKTLDTVELMQQQYINIDILDKNISNNDTSNNVSYVNCDHLMTNGEDVKKVNLNTYVIKKSSDKKKPKILPEKQKLNIKTKEYKTKGIKKKKNITNNYDENQNK
jgi:hypothetical protein